MTVTSKLIHPQTSEKIVLVTGATNGIGKEVAIQLAGKGYRVIIHGRNPKKIDQVVAEALKRSPKARLETIQADFSSLREVKKWWSNSMNASITSTYSSTTPAFTATNAITPLKASSSPSR